MAGGTDINKKDDLDPYDLYDMDLLTNEECPECGSRILSHPDCTTSCSECEWCSKGENPG